MVGVNGVILLSLCISLPIVLLCFAIYWTPARMLHVASKLEGQSVKDFEIEKALTTEDPVEWPALLAGGWTANLILYVVAVISYFRPIRIGVTFIMVGIILLGLWTLIWLMSTVVAVRAKRRLLG